MRGAAVLLLSSTVAFADATPPPAAFDDWGAPRVVLTSFSGSFGWRLDFALYEHRRVAYPPPGDYSGQTFMTVALTPDEEGALLAGLALDRVDRFHPPERFGSDGATECIHAWPDGKHAQACIWGGMDDEESWSAELRTPPEMSGLWKRLAHFSSPRARRWVPAHIPVTVKVARGVPACPTRVQEPWPTTWPRPDDGTLARMARGTTWTFALPAAELPTLQRLAGWSSPTPNGCDQGVFVRHLLVDVDYRPPMPPFPHTH